MPPPTANPRRYRNFRREADAAARFANPLRQVAHNRMTAEAGPAF
jgi:hypothetical protein